MVLGNMRLRYKIPLALIAIMIVITMFIGSSYALWRVTDYQASVNVIGTGCFEIEFNDTNSSSINLANAYPISNEKGLVTKPYTFTIKNNCTIDAEYKVYLNTLNVEQNKIPDNLIEYSIKKSGDVTAVANLLSSATLNDETSQFSYDNKSLLNSYIIATGNLKGRSTENVDDGEQETYNLRLWIDESAENIKSGEPETDKTIDETYSFEAAISTVAYATNLE